jgi:uncharacterized membrane protein YkoI
MKSHFVRTSLAVAMILVAGAASAAPLRAQKPATAPHQARIGRARAEAIALERVPGGKVKSSELEREKGIRVYSFDIEVPGKPGVEEVQVNARNGSVVSVTHESAAKEKAEARRERREAKPSTAR